MNPNAPLVTYQRSTIPREDSAREQRQAEPERGTISATDLSDALDNIFNHPNGTVHIETAHPAPVKSNPSPAYVARVAAVFNNNGRTFVVDMKASSPLFCSTLKLVRVTRPERTSDRRSSSRARSVPAGRDAGVRAQGE